MPPRFFLPHEVDNYDLLRLSIKSSYNNTIILSEAFLLMLLQFLKQR